MILRIVQRRILWLVVSAIILIPGLVFLFLGGLKLGTDFTGGALVQLRFVQTRPSAAEMTTAIESLPFGSPTIQQVGEASALIRLRELKPKEHADFIAAMQKKYHGVQEESYSSVGPVIGKELRQRAVMAILLVLLGIVAYISWAFRKSTGRLSGWAFGVNAVLALVHDLFITIGIFAMLGYFAHVEVDILFVTALLTVLGFSVHDTIVVFDRVREGLRRSSSASLDEIINSSVNTTLVRSINTSFTALLVLFSLFIFGGQSIHYFVLALIVGIIAGTYSSIFIASPLLPWWAKRQ